MANGFVATKKCDLLMHLYTMFEVARQWPFNKEYLNKSIAERELFEQNPESFKIPNYLLNVAMEIVKVETMAKPNYKAVKKAYEEAIPGFDPKSFKFEVTEDRRGGPRMI
uniref:Ras-GEF domain-containing protein n=1 Tax=Caenorhabditis tropicalis TaxID=1561998 RepID=A0A1I7V3W7_9PELO